MRQRVPEMAKDGDKTMIKLFLQRLLPELKAQGEGDEAKGTGGIQIVVNQNSPSQDSPKDVSEAVTINQIQSPEEGDEDDEEKEG